MLLTAGKYYVGDLCYLLGLLQPRLFPPAVGETGRWDNLLTATGYLGIYIPGTLEDLPPSENSGFFEWEGNALFCSRTAYGDGAYRDAEGREFWVDSGTIGCIPVSDELISSYLYGVYKGWHFIEFKEDFECALVDERGIIRIGHLEIKTGGNADWAEEEE